MDFKKLFQEINIKNHFLVIPDSAKKRIVGIKSQLEINNQSLYQFKILTESELVDLLSFKTSDETVLYQLEKLHMPVSITKEKIKFSKYNLKDNNLDLKEFLGHITNHHQPSTYFIEQSKDYFFHILTQLTYIKPFLDHYQVGYDVINIPLEKEPIIHKFSSKTNEVFYLFEKISTLLENNMDINKIYIVNPDSTYQVELQKASSFYHIPLNLKMKFKLYDLPYIRDLMEHRFSDIVELLTNIEKRNEVYAEVRKIDQKSFDQAMNDLISVFNKYPLNDYQEDNLLKVIKEDLKNTNISKIETKNAVTLIDLDEIISLSEDEKVFILNAKYESFPNIAKDNDYLSDSDKEIISYPTSSEVNENNQNYLKKIIHLKQVEYISYPEKDKYQQFTPSDIVSEYLKGNEPYTEINIKDLKKGYAIEYYKSLYATKDSEQLLTHFTGEFKLNDSEKNEIKNYLSHKKIVLTPTSITTYFKVPFVYYIEKILGLDTFTKRVDIYLGDFFHILIEVLFMLKYEEKVSRETEYSNNKELNEKIIQYIIHKDMKDFNYDDYFDEFFALYYSDEIEKLETLKNKDTHHLTMDERLWIRTLFYISKNKSYMTRALERLIDLEDNIPSEVLHLEKSVEINEFKGRADLVKTYSDHSFSVIDYKTGSRDSFHYEKILEIFKSLLSENKEEEITLSHLNLLQLIFYAYFINKKEPQLKLKNIAFYSYFEENLKLNALSTEDLDKTYYTSGKDRILSIENLNELYEMIEKLLLQTTKEIYDVEFPIRVRKDSKQKEDLEESIYSIYEALAYFNTNIIEGDENDD